MYLHYLTSTQEIEIIDALLTGLNVAQIAMTDAITEGRPLSAGIQAERVYKFTRALCHARWRDMHDFPIETAESRPAWQYRIHPINPGSQSLDTGRLIFQTDDLEDARLRIQRRPQFNYPFGLGILDTATGEIDLGSGFAPVPAEDTVCTVCGTAWENWPLVVCTNAGGHQAGAVPAEVSR